MALIHTNIQCESLHRPVPVYIVVPYDHMVMRNQPVPKPNVPMKLCFILEGVNGAYYGPIVYSKNLMGLAEDNNMIIVTVGGENKWYGESNRTKDCYQTMIARDLLNFMRSTFHISENREDIMIGGFSMGGFGALVTGLAHPDKFGRIFALEPALNREMILGAPEVSTWDLYTREQYEIMFGVNNIKDMAGTVNDYLYTGKKAGESQYPVKIFMAASRSSHNVVGDMVSTWDLADTLREMGLDVTYQDYEGLHNYIGFDNGIEIAFKWMKNDNTFKGNVVYYGQEAASTAENFAHWDCWYNYEADAREGKV